MKDIKKEEAQQHAYETEEYPIYMNPNNQEQNAETD